MRKLFGIALVSLLALPASAAAPATVPVQGYLTDTGGAVIDGSVSIHFAIYDVAVGGSPLWEETQSVLATDGFFTAYLGQATTLALSLFRDHGMVWLGVAVDGDSEMPRALMGSAPFAAYAEYGSGGGGGGIVIQGNATAQHLTKIVSASAITETPLVEEAGRITGIVDPIGPQDAATKHYVDSNSGGKTLMVYKSDASTLVGRYLDLNPDHVTGTSLTCDDLVYVDGQGLPAAMRPRDCTLNAQTWYYEQTNCTGQLLNVYLTGDWVTNFGQRAWAGSETNYQYCNSQSHRANDGTCTNEGAYTQRMCAYNYSATYLSQVSARLCGAGACMLSSQ
jgi:hypothetical protein